MTVLDVLAADVRKGASRLHIPKLSSLLVSLIGLVPFLLAWCARALVELVRLLVSAAVYGWDTAGRQVGTERPADPVGGGS